MTSSTWPYPDCSVAHTQRTLWSLLVRLTPNLASWRRRDGTSEVDFLSKPIALTAVITLPKFVPIMGCSWGTLTLARRIDIGSPRALLRLHGVGPRLVTLTSDYSDLHLWTQIMLWPDFAFFAPSLWSHQHKTTRPARLILDNNRLLGFQPKLSMRLSSQQNAEDPIEHSEQIRRKLPHRDSM